MRDWQYFIVQHDTSKIMKKKHPNFHYCILKGILRHLRRIPYYLVKPILWSIGHTDTAKYWEAKRAYKNVLKHIKWADADYSEYNIPIADIDSDNTIWIYWKQGIENAPQIVKKCIASVSKYNKDYRVIIVDSKNIHSYVKFPKRIEELHNKGMFSEAHFSDLLRLQLLILYGGIWIDATVLVTADMPEIVRRSPFFMFSVGNWWPSMKDPSKCSSWFIKSNSNNKLLVKTRNFLFEHWKHRISLIHYFAFHYALSALCDTDIECQLIWNDVPFISTLQPHYLQFNFGRKYDKASYDYTLSQCFVHKCTYKYKPALLTQPQENFLQHLLKDTP